jgi:stearoyl-CoA 9-desaturase NADPH oxidoreductase
MKATARMATAWQRTGGTVARRLFLDRQARFWARRLDGRWSPGELRAPVVDVVQETPDTKTFVLARPASWPTHRAGQYTTVAVEIDGVRHRRCYSISSAPSDPSLQLTVKRTPSGRVSRWLHAHVQAGDLLRLDGVAGDFILPEPVPQKLLFLSGGSGITPVMSMLRELSHRRAVRDLVFVHHARSRADVIFARTLEALAARHLGLRLVLRLDDDPTGRGRFDEARLAADVPDFASRATFLCGPPGLMARVERMWHEAGAGAELRRERFAPALMVPSPSATTRTVQLVRSGRSCQIGEGATLLEALERAGERPPHGCRIGICHTCKCVKRAGTVQNLVTGAVSSDPNEDIQLCITVPRSDLELGL